MSVATDIYFLSGIANLLTAVLFAVFIVAVLPYMTIPRGWLARMIPSERLPSGKVPIPTEWKVLAGAILGAEVAKKFASGLLVLYAFVALNEAGGSVGAVAWWIVVWTYIELVVSIVLVVRGWQEWR